MVGNNSPLLVSSVVNALQGIRSVIQVLEDAGFTTLENNCICPQEGSILVKRGLLHVSERPYPAEVFSTVLFPSIKEAADRHGITLTFVVVLTTKMVLYASGGGEVLATLSLDKRTINQVIHSVLASLSTQPTFSAEDIAHQLGPSSIIGVWALNRLQDHYNQNKRTLETFFSYWRENFAPLYRSSDLSEELYFKHTYLAVLLEAVLLAHYYDRLGDHPSFTDLLCYLRSQDFRLFYQDFFSWVEEVGELSLFFRTCFVGQVFEQSDIFQLIYQQLISPNTRLTLGEFYTPPDLACLMVEEMYTLGNKTLDPSCGSGTFLVEVVKRIRSSDEPLEKQRSSFKNIYGVDINPLAVAVTKTNLLLQLSYLEALPPVNVFFSNTLFPDEDPPIPLNVMDVVVGNPPWLVLNNIHSMAYKERVKNLAESLGIKPQARNVTQLELSALFLYQTKELYLRAGGKVGFVVSNAFLMGGQHDGTRKFHGFEDVSVWKFDQDLFNIHSICLFATKALKSQENVELKERKVKVVTWKVFKGINGTKFESIAEETYIPVSATYDKDGTTVGVQKLIPMSLRERLLPKVINKNNAPYFSHCYNGATLYPRSFFFVQQTSEREILVSVEPYMGFQAKKPWDFRPYEQAVVERWYLFQVAKSTELVPFLLLQTYPVFLPLRDETFLEGPIILAHTDKGLDHFHNLDQLFREHQKEGASVTKLWEQINYQNKLSTERQQANYKLVTNMVGSSVKAALVEGRRTIIDYSLYFLPITDLEEAYYLLGVLNAPCVEEDVKIRSAEGVGGGVRNIMKRPWEIAIPKFDPSNQLHTEVVKKARILEEKTLEIAQKWYEEQRRTKKQPVQWKPRTVQKHVLKGLKGELEALDVLVRKLFH